MNARITIFSMIMYLAINQEAIFDAPDKDPAECKGGRAVFIRQAILILISTATSQTFAKPTAILYKLDDLECFWLTVNHNCKYGVKAGLKYLLAL